MRWIWIIYCRTQIYFALWCCNIASAYCNLSFYSLNIYLHSISSDPSFDTVWNGLDIESTYEPWLSRLIYILNELHILLDFFLNEQFLLRSQSYYQYQFHHSRANLWHNIRLVGFLHLAAVLPTSFDAYYICSCRCSYEQSLRPTMMSTHPTRHRKPEE